MDTEVVNVSLKDSKSLTFNYDDDVLNKDPFDPKYTVTQENEEGLIQYFEKEIRDSFEYKTLIDMYKNILDVKSCVFFAGYNLLNKMKLEFHHHPFTLFDYTQAVVRKQMEANGGYVLENEVEKEVTLIHYKLMVGLVPLDPTAHAQVHDGFLDIHPDLIIGNYEEFYEQYNKWIPETTRLKFQAYKEKYCDQKLGGNLVYPKNFKYKPTIINASNKHLITAAAIDKLLIEDKLKKINNKEIQELLK